MVIEPCPICDTTDIEACPACNSTGELVVRPAGSDHREAPGAGR